MCYIGFNNNLGFNNNYINYTKIFQSFYKNNVIEENLNCQETKKVNCK